MNRYDIYIKPDYNFIHWLNDEQNNYKGYRFWLYFSIKETKIQPNGITINFYEFNEIGKPHVAYHYHSKEFSLGGMWNFSNYDNLCEAWRYINVLAHYDSFKTAIEQILLFYTKKIKCLCNQYMS